MFTALEPGLEHSHINNDTKFVQCKWTMRIWQGKHTQDWLVGWLLYNRTNSTPLALFQKNVVPRSNGLMIR